MRSRRPKRYVLLKADGEFSREDARTLGRYLEQRRLKFTLIQLEGDSAHLIVKTDVAGAATVLESCAGLKLGEKRVKTVLVSGGIGKLKKRAKESATTEVAEVPER